MTRILALIAALSSLSALALPTDAAAQARRSQPAAGTGVVVNGVELSVQDWQQLAMTIGVVAPGRYWYDSRSGAWGLQGGPAAGVVPAGLVGLGQLRADASGGMDTGYTVNGRRLHPTEAPVMRQLGLAPGAYDLDAAMNLSRGGQVLMNLVAVAQAAARQQTRITGDLNHSTEYRPGGGWSSTTGAFGVGSNQLHSGSDGETSYFIGGDTSLICDSSGCY